MMSDDDAHYGATVAKRRLARRLGQMRIRAGMSLNEASDKLGWKRGRLNRFEANLWRQPRQQILERADGTAPRLIAVITEAALMYEWGTAAERRSQAAHLAALSRRPGTELRLLRFSGGPHPGMSSLINIFDFPDDADP